MKSLKISFIIIFALTLFSCYANYPNNKCERLIEVSGIAKLYVEPDEAYIRLGVETYNENLRKARISTEKKINSIIKNIKKLGIKKDKINFDYIDITPKYPTYKFRKEIEGYNASQVIMITVNDFNMIIPIIETAAENGMTRLDNIRFNSTKMPIHKKKVRNMALEAAHDKALQIAKKSKINLGKLISVKENKDCNTYRSFSPTTNCVNYEMTENGFNRDSFINPKNIPLNLTIHCTYKIE